MADIQSFEEIYIELCDVIAQHMPHILWQDLWSDQITLIDGEHAWEAPAIFWEFRSPSMQDLQEGAQLVDIQIDVYLYYETFLDTAHETYNQGDALEYLKDLSKINEVLHGYMGEHIDHLRRESFSRVDTGGFGNLYRVTYMASTRDHSASKLHGQEELGGVEVTRQDFVID
jgi:hypothetical protein